LTEQRAKIVEVLLIRGGFFTGISRLLPFELCGRHCNKVTKLFRRETPSRSAAAGANPTNKDLGEELGIRASARNDPAIVMVA
jgi:hypothetical protein